MQTLVLNSRKRIPLLKSGQSGKTIRDSLPVKQTHHHPTHEGATEGENASIYFIGTATTVLEWEGVRILTDPNFLHAGDHVR